VFVFPPFFFFLSFCILMYVSPGYCRSRCSILYSRAGFFRLSTRDTDGSPWMYAIFVHEELTPGGACIRRIMPHACYPSSSCHYLALRPRNGPPKTSIAYRVHSPSRRARNAACKQLVRCDARYRLSRSTETSIRQGLCWQSVKFMLQRNAIKLIKL